MRKAHRALPGRLETRLICLACLAAMGLVAGCNLGLGGDSGAPMLQACVAIDGSCENLLADECADRDGIAQGPEMYCDDAEPNDDFADAVAVTLDGNEPVRWRGAVSPQHDLDVFGLGALSAGDRIVVDATTVHSPLDVSIALFDSQHRLVYNNDDRDGGVHGLDAYIDWIVRHPGDNYYLVVAGSAFAESGSGIGPFDVEVVVSSGFDLPKPVQQTVLLDFEGGQVDSPILGKRTVAPFNAGTIASLYRGKTRQLKELIRGVVEQNYERFNVTVMTSDDPPLPSSEECSTVFLGGHSSSLFGVAEAVDLYNVDFCDDAIVFSESFSPGVFSKAPELEELAVAIGNIAAHELGHLLGLNHVDDDLALMDDASPADSFLNDQEFIEAPLSFDVMPIGTQDAALLLSESVGLR